MESGEGDHPLRLDPLQALPDAVSVPRRPRPRAADDDSPLLPPHSHLPNAGGKSPPILPLPHTRADPRVFHEEARALLNSANDDPLISAVAEYAKPPESPPAGDAYAADIHEVLAAIANPTEDDQDNPPVAAGIVDRSDVTLFPSATERGAAAGVYAVRSRRNWAFGSSQTPSGSYFPQSPSTEPEYYHVKRSLADFSWLEERLRYRYEGIIVPPLPPMAFAGRLKHGYAYDAERLRGLERFLQRVATHAVLSTGDEVLAFLGATGEEAWRKIRREPISHESSITSALFGRTREGPDSNALDKIGHWGEKILWQAGRRVNKSLVWFLDRDSPSEARKKEDSAEARLERLQSYVRELGISLSTVRNAIHRASMNRNQEIQGMVSLQSAIHKLGEREGGKFGSYLQNVELEIPPEVVASSGQQGSPSNRALILGGRPSGASDTSSTLAVVGSAKSLPAARIVDDVFGDYEERAKGAQRIMDARRDEQDAYEHALAVYTKLRDRLESRTGSMWETAPNSLPSSGEGLEELVNDVSAASQRLADVRRSYQTVAVSTTDELRRLRTDMHDDLCEALQGLASEFAGQHAAHARAWAAFADTLGEYRDGSCKRE